MQVFGADNVYFEVQKNGIAEQDKANEGIVEIAREVGRPLVATGDVHYLRREDYDNHRALLCVQTKSTLAQPKLSFDTNEFFLKELGRDGRATSPSGPRRSPRRSRSPSAASVEIELGKMLIPRFPTPGRRRPRPSTCAGSRTRACGCATAIRRPPRRSSASRWSSGVIEKMGFSAYFLIVWDFVKYAKDSGIAVGPGRGSAAGSLVSYCLNITEVDPLAYGLLFERFLNPERVSMPDIDIDFSVKGRARVMRYVEEKYGKESVAQIVTFGKMLPRNATRDAARVLGLDYGAGDRLAKLIPEPVMGRSKSFDAVPRRGARAAPRLRLGARGAPDHRHRQGPRGDRAQRRHPRGRGRDRRPPAHRHRAGAADGGPRRCLGADGERAYKVVTQYSMKPIEEIGLLKMDFLGLRNLDVIEDCLAIIEESTGRAPGHGHAAARRPEDLRDDGPRRLDRRVPVRVRRHARGAAQGQARPSSRTWSR